MSEITTERREKRVRNFRWTRVITVLSLIIIIVNTRCICVCGAVCVFASVCGQAWISWKLMRRMITRLNFKWNYTINKAKITTLVASTINFFQQNIFSALSHFLQEIKYKDHPPTKQFPSCTGTSSSETKIINEVTDRWALL